MKYEKKLEIFTTQTIELLLSMVDNNFWVFETL